jgi:hypothetical protein
MSPRRIPTNVAASVRGLHPKRVASGSEVKEDPVGLPAPQRSANGSDGGLAFFASGS